MPKLLFEIVVTRWNEKAGLPAGCYTLPSYRRASEPTKCGIEELRSIPGGPHRAIDLRKPLGGARFKAQHERVNTCEVKSRSLAHWDPVLAAWSLRQAEIPYASTCVPGQPVLLSRLDRQIDCDHRLVTPHG